MTINDGDRTWTSHLPLPIAETIKYIELIKVAVIAWTRELISPELMDR